MTTMVDAWSRLPAELRSRNQWCVAGPDKAPYGVNPNGSLFAASVTKPSTWTSFEIACQAALVYGAGIGFVVSQSDPLTVIDMDVKDNTSVDKFGNPLPPEKWTSQEDLNRYWSIAQAFQSYTEKSRSGKGLHVWLFGDVGAGRRRDGIEVYSKDRFMICTGDVILERPIIAHPQMLAAMVSQMDKIANAATALIEVEEEMSDAELIDLASTAGNAEKFNMLCKLTSENYHEAGYPSQSEADLALMSIFTFYSKSNEQCRRLFRMTGLGKREKAVKNDVYLNRTLGIIRGRQEREETVSNHAQAVGAALAQQLLGTYEQRQQAQQSQAVALYEQGPSVSAGGSGGGNFDGGYTGDATFAFPPGGGQNNDHPEQGMYDYSKQFEINWPPGWVGEIAQFIYYSAPRPVKEVAIVAALGLMAGICGKAYNIPQSGLNLYVILVAKSAVGKESMHSGISHILNATCETYPGIYRFVDYSDFVSGPALQKAIAANNSFVNVAGEFGRKIKRMANEMDTSMQSLRTVMTNLYQKSSNTSVVGGLTYSDKDTNVASVSGVSFSLIGETTPTTMLEALTTNMMEDGFLSRFCIIEYKGDRVQLNRNPVTKPEKELVQFIGNLVVQSLTLNGRKTSQEVVFDMEAQTLANNYNELCDKMINLYEDEAYRQMWNRAHLKVLRLSALLAIGDKVGGHLNPVVRGEHVKWAIDVVSQDINSFQMRLESGDVGSDDVTRQKKILAVLASYMLKAPPPHSRVPKAMRDNAIIPSTHIWTKCNRTQSFIKARNGIQAAFDISIKALIMHGHISEVPSVELVDKYGFHGKAYRILDIPAEIISRVKSGAKL